MKIFIILLETLNLLECYKAYNIPANSLVSICLKETEALPIQLPMQCNVTILYRQEM